MTICPDVYARHDLISESACLWLEVVKISISISFSPIFFFFRV